MGARVAAELAICGFTVRVYDRGLGQSVVETVRAALREADQNELLGSSANAANVALSRVIACDSVGDAVRGCRLVCECVIEDPQVKADILNEASKVCPGDCVFTTSSMNLPLADIQKLIAPAWRNRLIGLRFLAPVLSMPLVEVTYEPGIEQRSECALPHSSWLPELCCVVTVLIACMWTARAITIPFSTLSCARPGSRRYVT